MTKSSDDGKHAMLFVFTDCWEVIFWRKKRGKMPFFVFIDPYRTRPGTGKTCSLHDPTPKTWPQKSLRNLRRLIRVLRLETWDSAGACGGRPRRHRRERKAPRAILELSDAIFAEVLWVILMFLDQGFLSQNLRFELYMINKYNFLL